MTEIHARNVTLSGGLGDQEILLVVPVPGRSCPPFLVFYDEDINAACRHDFTETPSYDRTETTSPMTGLAP